MLSTFVALYSRRSCKEFHFFAHPIYHYHVVYVKYLFIYLRC